MNNDIKKMERLLQTLEDKKHEQVELQTEEKLNLKRLKEEFDCSSIEEAQELLDQFENELEELLEEQEAKKKKLEKDLYKYGLA